MQLDVIFFTEENYAVKLMEQLWEAHWSNYGKLIGATMGSSLEQLWEAYWSNYGKLIGATMGSSLEQLWEAHWSNYGKLIGATMGSSLEQLWDGATMGSSLEQLWDGATMGSSLEQLWDGATMGSSLAPTLANFFLAHLWDQSLAQQLIINILKDNIEQWCLCQNIIATKPKQRFGANDWENEGCFCCNCVFYDFKNNHSIGRRRCSISTLQTP